MADQLSFRVSARTLLQLGAELISSDGIAFYELIKNAFDAKSQAVDLSVVSRIPQNSVDEAAAKIRELMEQEGGEAGLDALATRSKKEMAGLRESLRDAAIGDPANVLSWLEELERAENLRGFLGVLLDANHIEVKDKGSGMSLQTLRNVFLTIGTPFRAIQRDNLKASERPILGEKGLGRLSAMRLGSRLRVETSLPNEARWNLLELDWSAFDRHDETLLEEIAVAPIYGAKKTDANEHGTTLHISGLYGEWSRQRLEAIVTGEFSRLSDPFHTKRYRINVRYNGASIAIPRFEALLFEQAHATIKATYDVDGAADHSPLLRVQFTYRPPDQTRVFEQTIDFSRVELFSAAEKPRAAVLRSLGPWTVTAYWFNRRYLSRLDGIGEIKVVRELIERWSGGLMVFRDGFRVNPYGGPGDDWLGLDKKAFGSKGFKLNRQQIVGKVDIGVRENPALLDQTNREGLRDTPEKLALVALLKKVFEAFRSFINETDKEVKAPPTSTLADVTERLDSQGERLDQAWDDLLRAAPELSAEHPSIAAMRQTVEAIRTLIAESQRLAESYERGHGDIVNLASVGLTVEILAHELTRATTGALTTLELLRKPAKSRMPGNTVVIRDQQGGEADAFLVLEEQLRTLSKRLRVLDPLSTSGRQRKEVFDLAEWVDTILSYHKAQFQRHNIVCDFQVTPPKKGATMKVKMVKGMVVQIVENLISNSVYWLAQRRAYGDTFSPSISIRLDRDRRELRFHDNGPGIGQDRAELIFIPFNSTKPAGRGKGLGLYISKEIAEYNDARLFLDRQPEVDSRLRTFVLTLPPEAE